MNSWLKLLTLTLLILCCSFIFWRIFGRKGSSTDLMSYLQKTEDTILMNTSLTIISTMEAPKEPGIFFVETTDRMTPPALVVCSIESAAWTYPERPVYFLMKGLTNSEPISLNANNTALFLLASMPNVRILPLSFEELFKDTPLYPWYLKVDPKKQRYWTHHVSDACREVLLWKYGGIYMDTDVISLRPALVENFLAAESLTTCSSAVLGFHQHHPFLWDCMEDYVKSYNGDVWAQQGPLLFGRNAAKLCKMPDFAKEGDDMCQNFSYLQPKRFYPISFKSWQRYYEQWQGSDNLFNESYGLHFWNYMNYDHREVTAGSNTVAEHIFMDYCPLTYLSLVKKKHR